MSNHALQGPIDLVEKAGTVKKPAREIEEIWGKDLPKYRKEIFDLGATVMLFGALIMLFAKFLTIFEWSIPTIQGVAFFAFVVGVIICFRAFWSKA